MTKPSQSANPLVGLSDRGAPPPGGEATGRGATVAGAPEQTDAGDRRGRIPSDASPGEPRAVAYLYILPGFLMFAVFVLGPLGHTVWLSLFDWDGVTIGQYVGLDNYSALFRDSEFWGAFLHSLVLVFFFAVVPVSIGLMLAAAMSRAPIRGLTTFRTALFLPQVVSTVVVGVIWRWVYDADGPLNAVLSGLGFGTRAWLGDFTWALAAVGLIGAWVTTGFCVVLFMAGVQKIPDALYDAARVDGAGPIREFFAVTLPGLRNEIAVALTLTVLLALRGFDLIFVTTGGGPGDTTNVPALLMYSRAFTNGDVGSACAIGVVLAGMIFSLAVLITRIAERDRS